MLNDPCKDWDPSTTKSRSPVISAARRRASLKSSRRTPHLLGPTKGCGCLTRRQHRPNGRDLPPLDVFGVGGQQQPDHGSRLPTLQDVLPEVQPDGGAAVIDTAEDGQLFLHELTSLPGVLHHTEGCGTGQLNVGQLGRAEVQRRFEPSSPADGVEEAPVISGEGERAPDSIAEMLGRATPDLSASSAWDKPAPRRARLSASPTGLPGSGATVVTDTLRVYHLIPPSQSSLLEHGPAVFPYTHHRGTRGRHPRCRSGRNRLPQRSLLPRPFSGYSFCAEVRLKRSQLAVGTVVRDGYIGGWLAAGDAQMRVFCVRGLPPPPHKGVPLV